ncbi:MAG: diguanylate cyclase [Anaerolineae bacterium]|nr:diguanylate cyclase [Anaerolineae bacterium]
MPSEIDESDQNQELKQSFHELLPVHIKEMENLWVTLEAEWDAGKARQLFHLARRISLLSLSLNFTRLGIATRVIEGAVKDLLDEENISGNQLISVFQTINDKMAMVKQMVETGVYNEEFEVGRADFSPDAINVVSSMQESRGRRLIYLVENDEAQAHELAQQVGFFGYTLKLFNHLSEAQEQLASETPAAILIDIDLPEEQDGFFNNLKSFCAKLPENIQKIFISEQDSVSARLKAAYLGGKAYFSKPVNIGLLVDTLDRLIAVDEVLPYRILIVDDDNVQANINALHLKRAGMETFIVTDPLLIIQALNEFNPDLILLDMYMPDCSGTDLAVVIRQIESFVSIPIVFLSAETDREKQLEAVGLGGDDFLTKPIKPEHLTSAVTSRVDRYRQLRYLMMRDSLTGLLNHTTFKERYTQEFSRVIRLNKPLAYAMIDLDNFKQVNDTYGHTAGDRVLKSLASMLTKRLRSTDVIGRYGGEEFAVVLPNTSGQEAVKIFEQLCVGFEQIHHRTKSGIFQVTFSCGVSSYPECITPVELAETADKALYCAKHEGKNRVVSFFC